MLTVEALKPALSYYPFEGDFGMPTDRTLRDQIVLTSKDHQESCHICRANIPSETPSRVMVVKWSDDSGVAQYRWCYDCCVAMLLYSMDDHGYAMDKRYAISWIVSK